MAHPIASWVLSHFPGVEDISQVNPFAHCREGPAYKHCEMQSKTVELQGSGKLTVPAQGEIVSLKTIFISHVRNIENRGPIVVRRLFSHILAQQDDALLDQLYEARAVHRIPRGANDFVKVHMFGENPDFLYLKVPFIQTCMLINEENLMNGILRIPDELGKAHLPHEGTIIDAEGIEHSFPVSYYVLVPHGHILSHHLQVNEYWRQRRGIFAKDMNVQPRGGGPSFVLYYAVADVCFERIRRACIENWLTGKIDKRPLSELGVELDGGVGAVTTTFSYFVHPLKLDVSQVAPMLHPNFPSYALTIKRELEEQQFLRGQQLQNDKRKLHQDEAVQPMETTEDL